MGNAASGEPSSKAANENQKLSKPNFESKNEEITATIQTSNITSEELQKRIHSAAFEGDSNALEGAILDYQDFYAYDSLGRTPLFYAAGQDNVDCCGILMELRADLLDLGDSNGDTPLHVAAYYGHATTVRFLLEYMARTDLKNNRGHTAAHAAANVECLKLLHEYNVNIQALDLKGRDPLFCACATNRPDCVSWLCSHPEGKDMLARQDVLGDTATHAAACNGNLKCLQELGSVISYKNLTARNQQGYTPLELARLNKHKDCVDYLENLAGEKYQKIETNVDYNRRHTVSLGNSWNIESDNQNWNENDWNEQSWHNDNGYNGNQHHRHSFAYSGSMSSMSSVMERPSTAYSGTDSIEYKYNNYTDTNTSYNSLRPQTAAPSSAYTNEAFSYSNEHISEELNEGAGTSWFGQSENDFNNYSEVFLAPYEDDENDDERPKTPWTQRREQSTMEDWCGEWAKFIDNTTNQPFWWNSITGECTWEIPEKVKQIFADEAIHIAQNEAQQIRQRSYVTDRIGDWTECQDPISGDTFYYNNITTECEWELPREAEEQRILEQKEEEQKLQNEAEKEAEEWVWTMTRKTELRQQTKTDFSAELKWKLMHDEETGAVFYINSETGETRWEEPIEVTNAKQMENEHKSQKEKEEAAEDAKKKAKHEFDEENEAKKNEEIEERIKTETAKELALQVKEVLNSKENERSEIIEKMRKEFQEQLKETAKQTSELAAQIKAETMAARKMIEKDQQRIREADRLSNEKKEIMAEHGEELKQIAAVISSDRTRQNEKLKEKLKEKRKARALKRAELMNRIKSPTPKGSITPIKPSPSSSSSAKRNSKGMLPPLSPNKRNMKGLPSTPKKNITPQPSSLTPKPSNNAREEKRDTAIISSSKSENIFANSNLGMTIDEIFTKYPQLKLLVSVHNQFIPTESSQNNLKTDEGAVLQLIWACFRSYNMKSTVGFMPIILKVSDAVELMKELNIFPQYVTLDQLNHILSVSKVVTQVDFSEFIQALSRISISSGIAAKTILLEHIVPFARGLSKALVRRGSTYQKHSKQLATVDVRKLLQANVVQLKLIYMHYVMELSSRRKKKKNNVSYHSLPKKTISMVEVLEFTKMFNISQTLCTENKILQLYEDMTIRKPGMISSLENGPMPFNQWVQFLFHIGFRYCKPTPLDDQTEGSHLHMITLLRHMDDSLAKGSLKTKGVKPFTLKY